MIKIYDNYIPPHILLRWENYLTFEVGWKFMMDYPRDGKERLLSLGFTRHLSEFESLENLLLYKLKSNFNNPPITRAVFNCFRKGDKLEYHTDPGKLSYMFYLNPVWKRHWGAPTKFKSKEYHISRKVYPKPGRLVVFDSKLFHKGNSPSIFMPSKVAGRFSIVFQNNG